MRSVARLALLLVVATASCGDDGEDPTPTPPPASRTVVLQGDARLDGKPFDSDFVGALVLGDDGLATPCQDQLPPVSDGRYEVPVLSQSAGRGCGEPGAKVVLWTFAGDRIVYATNTAEWPTDGDELSFDPTFDSTDPDGAAPELAQFNGAVYDAEGKPMPLGTDVEAFVGETRCGVASVRTADEFVGYVMAVVGPEAVPGCTRDVVLTFRVEGEAATHNPVANRPPGVRDAVDLRL